MLRTDKEQVVAELAERLRASETLILADYRGLSVSELDDVRTKLLGHGARFSVVKNTLTKRAAEQAGVPSLLELLEGPTAIAFVLEGDMVAVAKTLNDTARQTKVLSLKGGLLQGQPVSADEVQKLAALPPADVLQSQVLGAVIGPLNAIVGLFTAPLRDLVGVLDARIEQLGGAAEVHEQPEPAVEEERPEPAAEDQSGAEAEAESKQDEGEEPEASAPETEGEENGN